MARRRIVGSVVVPVFGPLPMKGFRGFQAVAVAAGGFTGIKGLAKDTHGAVLAGFTIVLRDAGLVQITQVTADGSGNFVFPSATSGTRSLSANNGVTFYDNAGPFAITVPQDLGIVQFPDAA